LPLPSGDLSLTEILEDLERQLIQKAYDKAGGVKTETARLLGVKTSALYYKLEKYNIGVITPRQPSDKDGGSAKESHAEERHDESEA
jgi:DNA-binding NtrC family response regulator